MLCPGPCLWLILWDSHHLPHEAQLAVWQLLGNSAVISLAPFYAVTSSCSSCPALSSSLLTWCFLSTDSSVIVISISASTGHSLKTRPQNLGGVYSFLPKSKLVESVTYHSHSSEAGHFPHYKRVDRSHKKLKHHLKTLLFERVDCSLLLKSTKTQHYSKSQK